MSKIDYDLTKIKGIAFDVDGVLSPSIIPVDDDGNPRRMANIKDGYAMVQAIRSGLKLAIISGADTAPVRRRFELIGSADFKFFLTASPEVRAERRKKELEEKGYEVDFEKLKEEIIARDNQDMNREIAPLKQADDAVLIDTSSMTIEQVLQTIKKMIQEKI